MRIGVHVSISNGFTGALKNASQLECDGFQIFVGNPRGWTRKAIPESEFGNFKKERSRLSLWPVVVHLAYLPNLASNDDELYEKSVLTLAEDFDRANQLGADFFVFHPGKSKDVGCAIPRIALSVNQVLARIAGPTTLLFENQAGAGGEVAASFRELGLLIQSVQAKERVGVCFDTCHAFAAGYDLRNEAAWQSSLAEFEEMVGLSYLKLFHLNDCKGELGSHLDRHQHIGEGLIGTEGFRVLVNHPKLRELPGILETPQVEPGDDQKNLSVLRNMMRG